MTNIFLLIFSVFCVIFCTFAFTNLSLRKKTSIWIQKINTYHDLAKCNNGDILYFVHLPNAAVNLHQTIHYAIFCNVNNAGVQKNVIGINGLADLSFSPTAYHGVVASVISPGNFNGVGQVIYDTVAFPNILGELYVIDYELI